MKALVLAVLCLCQRITQTQVCMAYWYALNGASKGPSGASARVSSVIRSVKFMKVKNIWALETAENLLVSTSNYRNG